MDLNQPTPDVPFYRELIALDETAKRLRAAVGDDQAAAVMDYTAAAVNLGCNTLLDHLMKAVDLIADLKARTEMLEAEVAALQANGATRQ